MRKALIVVFLMLIVGFGVIGVTHATNESEVITPDSPNTIDIQS
ncbi:hypothetical protein [Ornithinibacillus bavariensis]|uniref:Uncharacterized protein n=1 Tax=Ornithinibacillus bavariensis TaxID=545502 RepID=A0A919X750_9BACI|nr:hypothetical protein [Ornithinibacillus bavariensis]GIO26761.1 hypothetical protein J43TS3_13720 [Ornithinibacillus bavariensis]